MIRLEKLLMKYLTELEDYGQELVKVAAVAFAMIECLERKNWSWHPRKIDNLK